MAQAGLAVAKIARLDFPKDWPDLLRHLCTELERQRGDALFRCLHVLLRVVKVLASKTLPVSRQEFQTIASSLFEGLLIILIHQEDPVLALLCFKCIRYVLVRGFDEFEEDRLMRLVQFILPRIEANLVSEKFYRNFNKCLLDLIDVFQSAFLASSIVVNVVQWYWNRFSLPCSDRLRVQQLLIVTAYIVESNSFAPELLIQQFVALLIGRFMVLSPEKAAQTDDLEEESDDEEMELSTCAALCLQQLFQSHCDMVCIIVLRYSASLPACAEGWQQTALTTEAVWHALCVGAYQLTGKFDFSAYCFEKVIPLVFSISINNFGPFLTLLQRRALVLISEYISDCGTLVLRSQAYQLFTEALKSEHLARTAAIRINYLVEDVKFDSNAFRPYLAQILNTMVSLLSSDTIAEQVDAMRKIVANIALIAERMKNDVSFDQAHGLMVTILGLWNTTTTAGGDSQVLLLKATIIDALTQLTITYMENLGPDLLFINVLFPVLAESFQASAFTHLGEDALNLWCSYLNNTLSIPNGIQIVFNKRNLMKQIKSSWLHSNCLDIFLKYQVG